ncbi:rRNA maturation RNase YbeY [Treponema ruminis]|uniref:Endoribonuclease YbeY n=1 Tax=Treponema ruminis TaxID=744515 RepID=A0A7W8G8J8_9SPIR|nr:rRNA maturation RNase YbeY [Treponema ruminis]MBB5225732.1 putative rRNA maturation factor [Treponema ruminis]QSI02422.1 rRNA maturation RNase YbeY [Treponema ruminis]
MANRIFISLMEDFTPPEWFNEQKVESYCLSVLEKLGYDGEEISVLFCNDEYIQELNKNYRDIDSPTDILSFENGEEYSDDEGKWLQAGDIAISLETLPKNAEYFSVSQNEEFKRLLIHGILHLNGYDHGEEHIESGVAPTDEMLVLQEKTLKEFGDINLI